MNPFEMVGYVVLGFVPTLVAMKIGWGFGKKEDTVFISQEG
ncbi:MAG: hypothetical protein ACRD5B_11985 [Nitrososphaeraceae archaeon]